MHCVGRVSASLIDNKPWIKIVAADEQCIGDFQRRHHEPIIADACFVALVNAQPFAVRDVSHRTIFLIQFLPLGKNEKVRLRLRVFIFLPILFGKNNAVDLNASPYHRLGVVFQVIFPNNIERHRKEVVRAGGYSNFHLREMPEQ